MYAHYNVAVAVTGMLCVCSSWPQPSTMHLSLTIIRDGDLFTEGCNYAVCSSLCRYDDYLLDDAPSLHGDYDEVRTEHGWEVDSFFRPPRVPDKGHVWLDPHILANPAIADIDGDGQEELVIAVSYFFDRDQYSRPVCTI